MNWQSLLNKEEKIILPWIGGRNIVNFHRSWKIKGKLPEEYGWYVFSTNGRTATPIDKADPCPEILRNKVIGYLVGNRIITDKVKITPTISNLNLFEQVHLIEPGLDKFVRISVGKFYENSPFIFNSIEMPLGPEDEVLSYFLDEKDSIDNIPNVNHVLDAAFRIEVWRKKEEERIRKEEQERREQEERRNRLIENVSSSVDRRVTATENFAEAARAALLVGGAHYLEHRQVRNEMVVRFRLNGRRYECTCNKNTLRIIDSGICLTDEYTGEKYDDTLTLESLPPTIRQADEEGRLVVFRHV